MDILTFKKKTKKKTRQTNKRIIIYKNTSFVINKI